MSLNPLFEAKSIVKVFSSVGLLGTDKTTAVDDVSFQIPSGQPTIITLAGQSGSGKTTIARMMLGLTKPTSGEMIYLGKSLKKMSRQERKTYRKDVQAIFQDPYGTYNPFYRVDRIFNVPVKKFSLASSKSEAKKLIDDALKAVGLRPEQVLGKFPHQFSGGERQRLMIARALLAKPKIMVADEPVSMLDASLRASVLDIILNLKENYGMSCLFVTHDLSVAYYLSDKIIILDEGRIVEMGDPEAVIKRPAHPYVQSLISSIPMPNPKKRWNKLDLNSEKTEEKKINREGCTFYYRCPKHMETCTAERPHMVTIEPNHEVACHLHS